MEFLEKDLEEIIFTSDRGALYQAGLYVSGKMYRQLRIGEYGIADLVTFDRERHFNKDKHYQHSITITVYELKKDKINISAFLQALGYVKGIQRYLQIRNFNHTISFKIVLIGKRLSNDSTFSYLPDFMNNNELLTLENYTYYLDIGGLSFLNECGYQQRNEGFSYGKTTKK